MSTKPTKRERRGLPPRYSSAAIHEWRKPHAGALKHRGARVPMRSALPPYERPSRKPDESGKRKRKRRGFHRRPSWA